MTIAKTQAISQAETQTNCLPVLPALDHVRELVELSLERRRDDVLLGKGVGVGRGGAAPLLADRHRLFMLSSQSQVIFFLYFLVAFRTSCHSYSRLKL